jgi:hypothetical protein
MMESAKVETSVADSGVGPAPPEAFRRYERLSGMGSDGG